MGILRDEGESWRHSWPEASGSHTAHNLKIELPSIQRNGEWFQPELDPNLHEWEQTIWSGILIGVPPITDRRLLLGQTLRYRQRIGWQNPLRSQRAQNSYARLA